MQQWPRRAFPVPLLGLPIWATLATWRRFVRAAQAESNSVVYRYGVRRFGVAMIVGLAIWDAFRIAHTVAPGDFFAERVPMAVIVSVAWIIPIGLWGGYGWGRIVANFFQAPRSEG